jgi:Tannase and feruloyl esterase
MTKGMSISRPSAACTTRLTAIVLALGTMMSAAVLADSPGDIDHKRHPRTALTCDDSMKSAFKPDANTTVRLVKAFKAGDPLILSGTPTPATPIASKDVCLVKLNVGPGNPGPADAPSTSAGIGMEIWLPAPANWNGRTRSTGDGAFAGNPTISSLTGLRIDVANWALDRDYVSSISDSGHVIPAGISIGSWAMNPDGRPNITLWIDHSTRSIHELAVKTKALAAAYYPKPAKFSYYSGCSGGGRTGYAAAQSHPEDFDGIYVEAPSINQTQFKGGDQAWSTFVTIRDLGGVPLTADQSNLLTAASIAACDTALNGKHEGYLSDPAQCSYDPSTDPAVLCIADGGTNATSSCVSKVQAVAVNKMWYGPTTDGSVPPPAADNGFNVARAPNHLWWGLPRGVNLVLITNTIEFLVADGIAQLTLSLQDPAMGTTGNFLFVNATGNGQDGWKNLSYQQWATSMLAGKALNDTAFGDVDANNPDLSAFRKAGGKMITLYGLADGIVPVLSTVDYYERASVVAGGHDKQQKFHRLFLEPGRGHCNNINGFGQPTSTQPKLNQGGGDTQRTELFDAVVHWVERGTAPTTFIAKTDDGMITRPVCMYPAKLTYLGGDTNLAASYACK